MSKIPNESIAKLNEIHNRLKIKYGSFSEEYPEQEMSVAYIDKDDIVLELGGNIGRNSCVIASILNDSKNLVVVETDPQNTSKLIENRDLNNLHFFIEDAAISKVELLQNGWVSKPKTELNMYELQYWRPIKTISWSQLKDKYKLQFTTLVADCEGALYYMMKEEPNLLDGINKIIIENDFTDPVHKEYVDTEFKKLNFNVVYTNCHPYIPNFNNFFEVWIRSV